ncbi:MAG: peptide chain release factor N(5)-glutamine methyltransferase [Bacteroidales bacterium]|nr:peptide chain release factor N(5)-glutamine methyltransferase [Bacteroidales bacterium]
MFPSNRVFDIRATIRRELAPFYPDGEIEMMTRMLMKAFLGWDTVQMLLHNSDSINQSDLLLFHHAVKDLQNYRPIQHIIGHTDFCGCRISVSPAVLIPRPETEGLVADVVRIARSICRQRAAQPRIIDLCTGSGCIAVAVAKLVPTAEVMAVDVSDDALAVARSNIAANGVAAVAAKADILKADTLDSLTAEPYDIIVSNPPYIMQSEAIEMRRNVTDYEPHLALFVDDAAPLLFYYAIAEQANRHLASDGVIAMEINEKLGGETMSLFADKGYRCALHQDIHGKDRILICHKSSE